MTSVDIVVHGRHVDVSTRFREQVSEKLARIDRFGIPISSVDVELSKENNPRLAERAYEVELTCRGKGPVIRAEAAAADKYAALDLASGRLAEQLRRAHDRARFHRGRDAKRIELPAEFPEMVVGAVARPGLPELGVDDLLGDDEVFASGPVVVRDKTHPTMPMTIEEAVTEMELVGHDFFLFQEVESAAPAVVYRRRGFDYGLIRIETASASAAEN